MPFFKENPVTDQPPANQSIRFTEFQCFEELLNFYTMNSNAYIYYYWLSRWYCAKK